MAKSSPAAEPSSLAYAEAWVDRLRHHLPQAVAWDADAIHQSRVATRRLAAAVDVVRPILSKRHRKPFAATLRKLRRQLGPLRDLDVMLGHVADAQPGPGRDWLRSQLEDQRTRCREHAGDRLDPAKVLDKLGAWRAVHHEWAEAGPAATDGLLAAAVHLQLDAFAAQSAALGTGDPHELRIAGKALRYTLEMAVAAGHPLPPAVAKSFKRMQDALGAWHDQVVLAERSLRASLDAQLAYHDPALHLSVADLSRAAVQRSQRHLAAFATLWQKRGDELAATIRCAFPLTVAGPSTDAAVVETQSV